MPFGAASPESISDGALDFADEPGQDAGRRPSRGGSPSTRGARAARQPLHDVRHVLLPAASRASAATPTCDGTEFEEVPLSRARQGVVVHRQPLPAAAALHVARPVRALRHRRGRAGRREDGRARPGRRRRRRRRPARRAARSSSSLETLYEDDDNEYRRLEVEAGRERSPMSDDVAVLGVGMHPWGKWGRNFVEYGVVAARAALADAGLAWTRRAVRRRRRHDAQRLSRATSPARRSRRRSAGRARGSRAATPRARRARRRSARARAQILAGLVRRRARRRRRHHAEGLLRARSAATAPTIPTGCASACSAPPTRPTSRSTPAGAWSCTARPSATSPR